MKIAIIGICLVVVWLFYNFYLGEKLFGTECSNQSTGQSEVQPQSKFCTGNECQYTGVVNMTFNTKKYDQCLRGKFIFKGIK